MFSQLPIWFNLYPDNLNWERKNMLLSLPLNIIPSYLVDLLILTYYFLYICLLLFWGTRSTE